MIGYYYYYYIIREAFSISNNKEFDIHNQVLVRSVHPKKRSLIFLKRTISYTDQKSYYEER